MPSASAAMFTKFTRSRSIMTKLSGTLIALFARNRELAYAVFDGTELIRFGIKTIRGRRRGRGFEEAIRRAVAAILRDVDEPLVVLERADDRRRQGGLPRALPSVIASVIAPRRIRTVRLSDAKRRFCDHPDTTRGELCETISDRHPVLRASRPTAGISLALAVALGGSVLGGTALHRTDGV